MLLPALHQLHVARDTMRFLVKRFARNVPRALIVQLKLILLLLAQGLGLNNFLMLVLRSVHNVQLGMNALRPVQIQ